MSRKTFECPNCGADVVVGKVVCRECGSDSSTGWQSSEEIDYQSIDIPDGYGPEDEAEKAARSPTVVRVNKTATIVALLVIGMLMLTFMRGCRWPGIL